MERSVKHWTRAEAEALIPELERAFALIDELVAQAEAKDARVRELQADAERHLAEITIEKSQMQYLANRINETLRRIADQGALPKGIDPALVDFPHRLGGDEVLLCWRRGETRITHYHGLDEGFAGRKELP